VSPKAENERRARKVYALTDELQVQLRVLDEAAAPVDLRVVSQPATDIGAMAFLVLLQAANSAQEDLRAAMEQVKAITAARKGFRDKARSPLPDEVDAEAAFHLVAMLYAKQLQAELGELLQKVKAAGELSEIDQLRLQMAMDRTAKMMSTLSNILKKISDTASQITQNLK
jgi:hypothetical protein